MRAAVLLVEEEEGLQELLRTILEPEGYDVLVAANEPEALAEVCQRPVAVIVLDMDNRGIDGVAFERALRYHGHRPAVPLLLLSASLSNLPPAKLVEGESYLQKPFRVEKLLEEVARLAGGPA